MPSVHPSREICTFRDKGDRRYAAVRSSTRKAADYSPGWLALRSSREKHSFGHRRVGWAATTLISTHDKLGGMAIAEDVESYGGGRDFGPVTRLIERPLLEVP